MEHYIKIKLNQTGVVAVILLKYLMICDSMKKIQQQYYTDDVE